MFCHAAFRRGGGLLVSDCELMQYVHVASLGLDCPEAPDYQQNLTAASEAEVRQLRLIGTDLYADASALSVANSPYVVHIVHILKPVLMMRLKSRRPACWT